MSRPDELTFAPLGGIGEIDERMASVEFFSAAALFADEKNRRARAAAKLQHPNVVAIYRVGEIDGQPYIVSEYIRGHGLNQLALPVPWQQALEFAIGLCRGLAAAHRRGILHRDLKLSNAILSSDGEIKLLDFGLAKIIESAAAQEELPALPNLVGPSTQRSVDMSQATLDIEETPSSLLGPAVLTGEVPALVPLSPPQLSIDDGPPVPSTVKEKDSDTDSSAIAGTPVYMAPEVLRGEPATRRSDIYSMGALLYALCTGDPPFRGLPFAELLRVVNATDTRPLADVVAGIPPGFAAVVDRCLRRNPDDRYGSADDLREALEALLPAPQRSEVPEGNPYRGLLPFEPKDRAIFFGRRSEVGTLVERLRTEPALRSRPSGFHPSRNTRPPAPLGHVPSSGVSLEGASACAHRRPKHLGGVRIKTRTWLGIGAAAIALLAVASVNARDRLLYNHTPSVPPGWYVRSADEIARGALVTVRAQDVAPDYAAARNFTDRGDRFIKRIAATGGDSVCAEGDAIRVNDRTVAHRAVHDSQGRALPHWSGCRTLRADEVLLMGDTPDSFDGRYFGPVSIDHIEGVWQPVF